MLTGSRDIDVARQPLEQHDDFGSHSSARQDNLPVVNDNTPPPPGTPPPRPASGPLGFEAPRTSVAASSPSLLASPAVLDALVDDDAWSLYEELCERRSRIEAAIHQLARRHPRIASAERGASDAAASSLIGSHNLTGERLSTPQGSPTTRSGAESVSPTPWAPHIAPAPIPRSHKVAASPPSAVTATLRGEEVQRDVRRQGRSIAAIQEGKGAVPMTSGLVARREATSDPLFNDETDDEEERERGHPASVVGTAIRHPTTGITQGVARSDGGLFTLAPVPKGRATHVLLSGSPRRSIGSTSAAAAASPIKSEPRVFTSVSPTSTSRESSVLAIDDTKSTAVADVAVGYVPTTVGARFTMAPLALTRQGVRR